MEAPLDLKPDLSRLLLGPLSLATDLYGAIIPGCVLIIIVCVKKHWASLVLTYPLLGFKSKIAITLIASFVVGKVLLSGFALFSAISSWLMKGVVARLKVRIEARNPTVPEEPPPSTRLGVFVTALLNILEAHQIVRAFVGGLLTGTAVKKFQLLDNYSAHNSIVTFHLGTGTALIVCSCIRGDGGFRSLELIAGVLLLISGLRAAPGRRDFFPTAVGVALNDFLSNLPPEQFSVVMKSALTYLRNLYETPAGQANGSPAAEPESRAADPAQT